MMQIYVSFPYSMVSSCESWIFSVSCVAVAQVYGSGLAPVIGADAVAVIGSGMKDSIYFMAGFNGLTQGMLVKFEVPKDLCVLNKVIACLNLILKSFHI